MNGAFKLFRKIRLDYMELLIGATGSQSNVLVAADLFNRLSFAVTLSGEPYSTAAPSIYLQGNAANCLGDVSETKRVYLDSQTTLMSQAFDSTNYNVPEVVDVRYHVPLNLVLECFSGNASGSGVAWDTKSMNIFASYVSDSAAAPSPTLNIGARIFFTDITRK